LSFGLYWAEREERADFSAGKRSASKPLCGKRAWRQAREREEQAFGRQAIRRQAAVRQASLTASQRRGEPSGKQRSASKPRGGKQANGKPNGHGTTFSGLP
jgi:hypothetical protein